MSVTRAMLMAAGLGTRLRPFTDLAPKAMMPVMGVPIAQFALDSIVRAGAEEIVVNIHHHAARVRSELERLDRGPARIVVSDESAELLGSAGGLRKASPRFQGEPFFLVNADVLCDVDLKALARTHEDLKSRWNVAMTLAVFPEPPTSGRYREIYLDQESGLVRGFSPDLRSGRPFFIGSAILEQDALREVPLSGPAEFVPTILEPMIREKKVGFHLTQGIWKDIGAPSLWLDAHLFLIRALETGRLPAAWRQRLEATNQRLSSEIWVSRVTVESGAIALRERATRWAGPCYFSGSNPPIDLGPEAVLYGPEPKAQVLVQGIGMGGRWVAISG